MDLLTLAHALRRRRRLLAASLAVAALATAGTYWRVAPTYQVTATALVLPPSRTGVYQPPAPTPARVGQPTPAVQTTPTAPDKLVNPYLSFDSSTFILARVVTQSLAGDTERRRVAARGGTSAYQVTTSLDEPVVNVVVTDHDPRRAARTLHLLLDDADAELADRQQATGMPREHWAAFTPVVVADTPVNTNQRLKVVAAVGALAVVAAFGLVLTVESVAAARRRRGSGGAEPATVARLPRPDVPATRRRVVHGPGDRDDDERTTG
jgi:capsular polysaccharide biosynthesis protein